MMRVALFGTSADPPTSGHQAILGWLAERYDWVAVWAADNPFKSHQTALEHRGMMLRLLIEGMQPPRHNIGFHPELSSYRTWETVRKAREIWDNDIEFTLVIGSDLAQQLPKWYKVEDLLKQVRLLIVPRPGYMLDEGVLQQLRQLGADVAIADLIGLDVSSTAFRDRGDTQAVTPPIKDYIHQEHLYECQDVPKESLPIR
ncbi:nicotinate-nucleotide adenylyltransferase [Aliterella atlantica CENA595]|uniref:nicotinate-nucleotide adenylyltransferase n=2 Tax=Aliterella TaxID=1827277 RepID=A0A0D8ZMS3_9CYAN|nr:nicotinate-nucleotide adenylyltransferase [Aliterella atlantica]KJH69739.1 nicotinate-nucleotide adenylyltransferase [Aliterella atlantica CENA595]